MACICACGKAVLEQAGYAVLSATDEAEALEVLREAPVCLVLPDHMLRGTTGTDLCEGDEKDQARCAHHRVLRHGAGNDAACGWLHQQR